MALFSDKSKERHPPGDSAKDSPPLEPGEAAVNSQDVHSRADALERAATRPLNISGDLKETLGERDNLERDKDAGAALALEHRDGDAAKSRGPTSS